VKYKTLDTRQIVIRKADLMIKIFFTGTNINIKEIFL